MRGFIRRSLGGKCRDGRQSRPGETKLIPGSASRSSARDDREQYSGRGPPSRKILGVFLAILAFLIPLTARAQTYYFTGNLPSVPEVSTSPVACDGDTIGAIRYNTGTAVFEGCNGVAWADIRNGAAAAAAGSTGQVQFNSGGLLGANANLFWDNTNGRLGIGTASPGAELAVIGSSDEVQMLVKGNATQTSDIFDVEDSGGQKGLFVSTGSFNPKFYAPTGGSVFGAATASGWWNDRGFGLELLDPNGFNWGGHNAGLLVTEASNRRRALMLDVDPNNNLAIFGSGYAGSGQGAAPAITFRPGSLEAMRILNTGLVGIGTPTPGTAMDVNGGVTMEPTTVTLIANNTVLATANRSYFQVTSDNTTAANRIFCFGAGTLGQVLVVEWTSSTNRGEIVKGGNCGGAGGAVAASIAGLTWAPHAAETILQLMYNGTHWIQIAGSANY